ncbi:primary-amine oxidase [Mucilaginibacter sp. X5P1]|uniref:primary-amine oxidase n=1 Tax=Mucilaginibacter sp. X5P1 TaxID=2723088 RepID=UPI0016187C02|nr:primary-amine oxidase [Mucilaginibacter sp. X5P1]MBB6136813.1 primary-amine oxidase [Mucilaginibacter sp. X5P1]
MIKSITLYGCLALLLCAGKTYAQTDSITYPLDPLTAKEMQRVVQILKDSKTTTGKDIFNIINLKEPPKREVLAYKPGAPFRREAFTSFYDYSKNGVTEAVVDLNINKVISVKNIPNVIGMGLEADSAVASEIVRKDKNWVAALKKRGISIDSVTHRSVFTGDLGIGPIGHREQLVIARRKKNNIDIEGLMAYADFTTGKILKIVDESNSFSGMVDLNYFNKDSVKEVESAPKPLIITQPEGHNFQLKGHEITWQNWKMRFGVDNREGLVIYNVRYVDNGKERSVMYRGSMPEMVVPYGSPDLFQASYNFFDAGEYRLGQGTAQSLSPGADAPENAAYVPAILHTENGVPFQVDRAVAVYEEYGGVLWRHGTVSRRATNLCIKYYTMIENYDYAFTWKFHQDGTIDVDVELTGIVEVKGVHRINEMDAPDKDDLSYQGHSFGTLVHPHVEAINHQHFFVFRLDMDIDGANNNAVEEMNSKLVPPGPQNPYGNAFYVDAAKFKTELEAQRDVNYESARNWHIMNNNEMNDLGQHVGYMLMPGAQAKTFVPEGSLLLKKASFLNHQIWVTQYHDDEIYPAGKYPASNKVYDGLATWTAQDRNIDNNDIVVWYVAGITHIVRPEEWPIMSVHHMGFTLMPFGFFSSNPTFGITNPAFIKKEFKYVDKKQAGSDIDHQ